MAKTVSRSSAKAAKKAGAKRPAAKSTKSARAAKSIKSARAAKSAKPAKGVKSAKTRTTATKSPPGKPALLSGGNPQIAKGYGDEPVQAYIAAMPGWKSELGRRIDALVVRAVPSVRKAVKWNSPFYGMEEKSFFLSFHCFTKYIKVAFFRGASLRPDLPGQSKHTDVRYLDIHEHDALDEAQFVSWVKQASELPGEKM